MTVGTCQSTVGAQDSSTMTTRSITSLLVLALVACLAGCAQRAQPSGDGRVVRTNDGRSPQVGEPGGSAANPLDAFDPLGSRLQDIGGLIIHFHGLKKRMPASLDELKTIAGPVPATDFVEPQTGKPFVYLPQAARMSPGDRGIVCYAPTPAVSPAGGVWYQATLVQIGRPGQLSASWAVTLSQAELQAHLGAPIPTSQPAP